MKYVGLTYDIYIENSKTRKMVFELKWGPGSLVFANTSMYQQHFITKP